MVVNKLKRQKDREYTRNIMKKKSYLPNLNLQGNKAFEASINKDSPINRVSIINAHIEIESFLRPKETRQSPIKIKIAGKKPDQSISGWNRPTKFENYHSIFENN